MFKLINVFCSLICKFFRFNRQLVRSRSLSECSTGEKKREYRIREQWAEWIRTEPNTAKQRAQLVRLFVAKRLAFNRSDSFGLLNLAPCFGMRLLSLSRASDGYKQRGSDTLDSLDSRSKVGSMWPVLALNKGQQGFVEQKVSDSQVVD